MQERAADVPPWIFSVLLSSSLPPSCRHQPPTFNLLHHVCSHFAATVQKDSISWSAGVEFHKPGTERRVWSRRRESGRRLSEGSDPPFTFSCLTTIKMRLHRRRLQGRNSAGSQSGKQGSREPWFSGSLVACRHQEVPQCSRQVAPPAETAF